MRRNVRDGLGRAYIAGFRWALERDYEIIMGMDADLSHDPVALPSLIAAIENGADLAIGSRYIAGGSIPNWPAHRRALSSWGNRYGTRLLRLDIHDATSGFRAYRSTSLAKIDLERVRSSGYCFLIELVYRMARLGGEISEVPITFIDRERGSSKMNGRVMVESLALVTLWGLRDRVRGLAKRARHA